MSTMYVYCIAPSGLQPTFGPIGLGLPRGEVVTVQYRDLAAIVSEVQEFDLSGLSPESIFQYLGMHQTVVEQVMKKTDTVLPVKFGTVAADRQEVLEILAAGYEELSACLQRVEGLIELDLIVTYSNMEKILAGIAREPEIARARTEAEKLPSGRLEKARIELGLLVMKSLSRRREQLADEISAGVAPVVGDIAFNDRKDDAMVLNAGLLLRKEDEPELHERIADLDEQFGGGLHFKCVGPLPPYSFSTVEIEKVGRADIESARRDLDLADRASLKEIGEAHRERARQLHPDRNRDVPGVAARFQALGRSYRLLHDICMNHRHDFEEVAKHGYHGIRVRQLEEIRRDAPAAHGPASNM